MMAGLVLAATPVQADEMAGMAAFVKGDYRTASLEWQPLAEKGQAEAQFNLGVLYDQGLGVNTDYAQAQFNLAVLHANGLGVAQSNAEAARWYRRAAVQGLSAAQFNLGVLYETGTGIIQDYRQAADWYRRAAEQGHAAAQNNLGLLYANGQGVTRDLVIAYAWYTVAAAQDNAKARFNRDQLARSLTPGQTQEGEHLAAEYRRSMQSPHP